MRRLLPLGLAALLAASFTATCLAGCLGADEGPHACCADGLAISAPSSDCCSQVDGTRTDDNGQVAPSSPHGSRVVAAASLAIAATPSPAPRIAASPPLVLRI